MATSKQKNLQVFTPTPPMLFIVYVYKTKYHSGVYQPKTKCMYMSVYMTLAIDTVDRCSLSYEACNEFIKLKED